MRGWGTIVADTTVYASEKHVFQVVDINHLALGGRRHIVQSKSKAPFYLGEVGNTHLSRATIILPFFLPPPQPWANPPPRWSPRQRVGRPPRAAQSNTHRHPSAPLTSSTPSIKCPPLPRHRSTTLTNSRRNAVSLQYHALSTLGGQRRGSIRRPSSSIMHWLERGGRRL